MQASEAAPLPRTLMHQNLPTDVIPTPTPLHALVRQQLTYQISVVLLSLSCFLQFITARPTPCYAMHQATHRLAGAPLPPPAQQT